MMPYSLVECCCIPKNNNLYIHHYKTFAHHIIVIIRIMFHYMFCLLQSMFWIHITWRFMYWNIWELSGTVIISLFKLIIRLSKHIQLEMQTVAQVNICQLLQVQLLNLNLKLKILVHSYKCIKYNMLIYLYMSCYCSAWFVCCDHLVDHCSYCSCTVIYILCTDVFSVFQIHL